jgi:hypothetical protein
MKTASLLLGLVFIIQGTACKKESAVSYAGKGPAGEKTAAKSTCPVIDPSSFATEVTNPYFPLVQGTTWHYINRIIENNETSYENNTVTVTPDKKIIEGVNCTVVHDVVTVNGEITENTYDWYAQDKSGNVWYFGEHTKSLKDKNGSTTEGSWKAGEHNACPGIIMWADPQAHAGETSYQEFLPGIAEDQAQVVNTNSTVTVPFGTFSNCVKTKEFTDLEPGVIENKYYAPGIGLIKTEMITGGNELETLTAVTHQ